MTRTCFAVTLSAVLAGWASPAAAGLQICNKTSYPVSVALGFFDGKQWSSEGWWNAEGGQCAQIVKDALNARYYYLYAVHHEVGGNWEGNRSFCIGDGQFRIEGRADCRARGYASKQFFQIDTGAAPDWTENLAD